MAHPQAGQGTWSRVGIVDEELGLFDPALVGDDNYTVITTYNMPIDYNMYPIDFEMPGWRIKLFGNGRPGHRRSSIRF